jgi:hypothetical protein
MIPKMNLMILLFVTLLLVPPQNSLGTFADQSDVGNPLRAGRATYNADKDEYSIEGAGANILGQPR